MQRQISSDIYLENALCHFPWQLTIITSSILWYDCMSNVFIGGLTSHAEVSSNNSFAFQLADAKRY